MKIGLFSDFYPPAVGGISTSVINAQKGLEALGHEVFVFTSDYNQPNPPKNVVSLPSLPIKWDGLPFIKWKRSVFEQIAQYELDIVHIHTEAPVGLVGMFVAREYDIPLVHTMHTFLPGYIQRYAFPKLQLVSMELAMKLILKLYGHRSREFVKLKRGGDLETRIAWNLMMTACNQSDLLIVPSQHLADKIKDAGFNGILNVVANGVNIDMYSPDTRHHETVEIISTSRLSAEKSIDRLIEALGALPADLDWHATIVGDGLLREELEQLAKSLKITKKVSFVGEKSSAEISKLLGRADIFVLTSNGFDNQPMSILEAIASGLPVVYCDPDLVEGLSPENARLVKPHASAVATALSELISNNTLRKDMSLASRKAATQYSHTEHAAKLVKAYKTLLTKDAAP